MISRYALYTIGQLSDRFSLSEGLPKGVRPHYNNSPTISAPVIVNDDGMRRAKLMKWGLVAKGAKDTNSVFRYKTYNISSEKILTKHSWERLVRQSRCLVPANGFYALNGSGKKRAYYAQAKDESLLAFAGVYSSWQDPEGIVHGTYSVLTTEATDDMPDFNDRMPAIIRPEDEANWLDAAITDTNSIYGMLHPHPSGLLDVYEVNPAVHSPKPNRPDLIDRLGS